MGRLGAIKDSLNAANQFSAVVSYERLSGGMG
jgi:hypothetical protein